MKSDNEGAYIEHEYNCTDCGQPGKVFPLRQQPKQKTVNLDGPPPILEVSQLNVPGAVEVYALLFESAYKDRRWDVEKHLPWSLRADAGATSEWSIKGLARQLHLGKEKVGKAMDALLDAGFIRVLGFFDSGNGSAKRLFQVVKYNQLDNVREALAITGTAYGKVGQMKINNYLPDDSPFFGQMTREELIDSASDGWDPDLYDATDKDLDFLDEDYDPGFCGLWEGNFHDNVKTRLSTFSNKQTDCGAECGVSHCT